MPNITVRNAEKKDTEFARKVHHLAFRDVIVKQFGPWNEKKQDELFDKGWQDPGYEIISCDNHDCGYTRVEHLEDQVRGHELVILPKYQNKGIGSFFLNRLKGDAKAKGVPARLQVLKMNRAKELYERFGFKMTGETDTHFIMEWAPEK